MNDGLLTEEARLFGCRETAFDILTTAELYSAAAGVLAGFAFAALVLLLTLRLSSPGAGTNATEAAQVLTIAIFGLVVSAIAYAVLAGGRLSAGRAASEEVFLGCEFAAATVSLFYAITLLFDAAARNARAGEPGNDDSATPRQTRDLQVAASWLRSAFGFAVVPLIVLYLGIGCVEYAVARTADVDWLPTAVSLAAVLPFAFACDGWRRRNRPTSERSAARFAKWFHGTLSLVIVGSAFAFALTEAQLAPCQTADLGFLLLVLAASIGFLCLSAWRFTRGSGDVHAHV